MQVVNLHELNYDGSQLQHAFAYKKAAVLGPTIAFFRGSADVKDHLVDLEDKLANDFIKSADMWHFIIEIPDATITEAVALQRLFICLCIEMLEQMNNDVVYERRGDDIIVNGKKLSVSIATLSRFSALIHVGINITVGDGCPVDAIGLSDFIASTNTHFEIEMANAFKEEYDDIKNATYKVTMV